LAIPFFADEKPTAARTLRAPALLALQVAWGPVIEAEDVPSGAKLVEMIIELAKWDI
jgi:hypothetical protein